MILPLCEHCGDEVPEHGMTYCGKACAALGPNKQYAHLFEVLASSFDQMSEDELKEYNRQLAEALCPRHSSQFRNTCGYCAAESSTNIVQSS